MLMTARRSVFSEVELADIQTRSVAPVKVIDFLLAGHLTSPIGVRDLVAAGNRVGGPARGAAWRCSREWRRKDDRGRRRRAPTGS